MTALSAQCDLESKMIEYFEWINNSNTYLLYFRIRKDASLAVSIALV